MAWWDLSAPAPPGISHNELFNRVRASHPDHASQRLERNTEVRITDRPIYLQSSLQYDGSLRKRKFSSVDLDAPMPRSTTAQQYSLLNQSTEGALQSRVRLQLQKIQIGEKEVVDLTQDDNEIQKTTSSSTSQPRPQRYNLDIPTGRQQSPIDFAKRDIISSHLDDGRPNTASDELRTNQAVIDLEEFLMGPPRIYHITLPSYSVGMHTYAPGKTAELRDGTFLRIITVRREPAGPVHLNGYWLVPQSGERLVMPDQVNELVWVCRATSVQPQATRRSSLRSFQITEAAGTREVIFTNHCFSQLNTHHLPRGHGSRPLLFCRWKRTRICDSKIQLHNHQPVFTESGPQYQEGCIERISHSEADDITLNHGGREVMPRGSPTAIRQEWRGVPPAPLGSHVRRHSVFDVDSGKNIMTKVGRYTFGDCFCGAGGTSCGARAAGLVVKWGFDMDNKAMQTYLLNFADDGTRCYEETAEDFLKRPHAHRYIVDILHLSPPCQAFSPAKTVLTPFFDEANQAALFTVRPLIEKLKPRVVTLEETFGLPTRHYLWFAALINDLISLGYSVRWRLVDCGEYNVAQSRCRVWMNAAGPGEKLPPFAPATHGDGPGLKPKPTIFQSIHAIPADTTHHNPDELKARGFRDGLKKPRYDAHTQAKTLTCNGGEKNYHPSGERPYTGREVICLQTFPLTFWFGDAGVTTIRKQAGNAVPPNLAEAMFKTIIKSLQETDRKEVEERVVVEV